MHVFRHQKPTQHCTLCLKIVYPEEVNFREYPQEDAFLLCRSWEIEPIFDDNGIQIVVCPAHLTTSYRTNPASILTNFPGPNIDQWLKENEFSYRERACLSPVKIMSQITRGRSRNHNYCGHYEQTGATWSENNVEFTQMLYGGLMGSPYIRGMMTNIDQNKVRRLFAILQSINPLLQRYNLPEIRQENQRNILHTVVRMHRTVPNENAGIHNYIMSIDNTDPIAAQHALDELVLCLDSNNNQLSFRGEPAILALIFPYLFTRGLGYYSLSSPQDQPTHELEGGYAQANSHITISKYTKQLILSRERRFGKCIEFLFFMLDYIEKKNIHSAQRFVLPVQQGRRYTRRDVHDGTHHIMGAVSLVPHTIQYQELLENQRPWDDPVIFAMHFKRNFQEWFNLYILKSPTSPLSIPLIAVVTQIPFQIPPIWISYQYTASTLQLDYILM
ncbi:hypothetical protein BD770DRAFT_449668 [Pilaira anomala]|nr:hypothetical protein BD770DRAFT_449668 [Pilaira anomala]